MYFLLPVQVGTNSNGPWSLLTDFKWQKVLGKGAFGQVHLCENKHTHEQRAIKLILPKGGEFSDDFKRDIQETELQQKLASCPHIARIYSWGTFSGAERASPNVTSRSRLVD